MTDKKLPFSSFLLAEEFLDELNTMDIVSSADTLKYLVRLALQYKEGTRSKQLKNDKAYHFFIHRVDDALLVDSMSFDVANSKTSNEHPNFENGSRRHSKSESANVKNSNHNIELKPRITELLASIYEFYRKNLSDSELKDKLSPDKQNQLVKTVTRLNEIITKDFLMQAIRSSSAVLDSESITNSFLQKSKWTFQDLSLLTGNNLKIFGDGQDHPAVSVQLARDEKPVNILTGVDTWLDNLIADIPEVVMFFHDNDVISNFEKLPTSKIPEISDFDPEIIKSLTTNIVSYLRKNCTEQGHTYWMFKPANDDIVKLYDLTSFGYNDRDRRQRNKNSSSARHPNGHNSAKNSGQNDQNMNRWTNPYTIPVANLLINVAKMKLQRLKKNSELECPKQVRELLVKAIILLESNDLKAEDIHSTAMNCIAELFVYEFNQHELKPVKSKKNLKPLPSNEVEPVAQNQSMEGQQCPTDFSNTQPLSIDTTGSNLLPLEGASCLTTPPIRSCANVNKNPITSHISEVVSSSSNYLESESCSFSDKNEFHLFEQWGVW